MANSEALRPWLRSTLLGWCLGMVLVIPIAIITEIGGLRALQIPVGLGMGFGVGIAQERILRPILGSSSGWLRASALGMALPFLMIDLARSIGMVIPYSFAFAVMAAGAAAGVGQAPLLRPHGISAGAWVLASIVGWSTGALLLAVADAFVLWSSFRGLGGALLYVALLASGGLFLGAATSVPLRPLALRNPVRSP